MVGITLWIIVGSVPIEIGIKMFNREPPKAVETGRAKSQGNVRIFVTQNEHLNLLLNLQLIILFIHHIIIF